MNWITESALILADRGDALCQVGHLSHLTKMVNVDLSKHTIPDIPKSKGKFICTVYNWEVYNGIDCYCPGNDELSLSVDTQGIWEGYETSLALDIVKKEPGIVLDFGANVGWYSILLALKGCDILAVEANEDNFKLLKDNAILNGVEDKIIASRGWIGPKTPVLSSGPRIRFLKSDVEGLEDEVIRVCSNLIKDRLIDYLLLEVSPVFADHYPKTLKFIIDCDYDAFLVPEKGFDPVAFSSYPLLSTLSNRLNLDNVPFLKQRSVLLVRNNDC